MLGRASSAGRNSPPVWAGERLAERRRTRRRRVFIAFLILLLLLSSLAVYGLRQSAVRISHVEIFGLPAQSGADASFATYATDAIQGYYFGLIPRDSIFFFPEERIRADILAAHSGIAAVSIFRANFDSLSIKVDVRAPVARWCGLAPTVGAEEYCYVFDASGFIYAAVATTTETINAFALYAPLVGGALEPLGASIANAEKLPAAFDFARQLDTLGSPVTRVVLRGDEVDDYLVSGARVTYVLAHEQDAFTALVSASANLNLADGSIDYIDLRFDGKVYVKRKQEAGISDTVSE